MRTFIEIVKYLKEDLSLEHGMAWKPLNRTDRMYFRRELRNLL